MANKLILRANLENLDTKIMMWALDFKGVAYDFEADTELQEPLFIDNGNTITDCIPILTHLDERFPAPPFLQGDVHQRSRIRMIVWKLIIQIKAKQASIDEILEDFVPFIKPNHFLAGDTPTLLDIIVASICPHTSTWEGFYGRMYNYCSNQLRAT